MGIGVSIFLLALGAILAFAVTVDDAGWFNINTIGIILMIAGVVGLLMTLFLFGDRGTRTTRRERRVVDDDVV